MLKREILNVRTYSECAVTYVAEGHILEFEVIGARKQTKDFRSRCFTDRPVGSASAEHLSVHWPAASVNATDRHWRALLAAGFNSHLARNLVRSLIRAKENFAAWASLADKV
jgi:hypothetical protein